jgi:hypothetical protein
MWQFETKTLLVRTMPASREPEPESESEPERMKKPEPETRVLRMRASNEARARVAYMIIAWGQQSSCAAPVRHATLLTSQRESQGSFLCGPYTYIPESKTREWAQNKSELRASVTSDSDRDREQGAVPPARDHGDTRGAFSAPVASLQVLVIIATQAGAVYGAVCDRAL